MRFVFKEATRWLKEANSQALQAALRNLTGKFFVSVLCQVQHTPLMPTGKQTGIDLGLKDFAVASDGVRFKRNYHLKRYERQLAKAQRHLSRKMKGSNSRDRQRLKVAAIHEKVANARLDHLHKVSSQITNEYDTICLASIPQARPVVNVDISITT